MDARTLTVQVTAAVERVEITAYGARKAILDQSVVPLSGGPGEVVVPWVGDPGEVVLLDVKLHSASAWAGFTYSPWFLDIPHDDVLFETNASAIPDTEAHKLEATLRELEDVIDKYGEIVPVKLFIAGCTDTVGDAAHNQELSLRRARAIAEWLRAHGYTLPIYYYGFGERFLAVGTGDGVDEARNRRVLYLVGANPPPPSTGVPQVGWRQPEGAPRALLSGRCAARNQRQGLEAVLDLDVFLDDSNAIDRRLYRRDSRTPQASVTAYSAASWARRSTGAKAKVSVTCSPP